MNRAVLTLALLAGAPLGAQELVVQGGPARESAAIIIDAAARPHLVLSGTARLDLPRDSTVASSLIVLGRPVTVASRVQGDVIVVGADLYLHPGADISGRAVAVGGSVVRTTLGHVGGEVRSFRYETYDVANDAGRYALFYRALESSPHVPLVDAAGLQGVLPPTYDRVDGLSLPVGLVIAPADGFVEVQPTVTYRSRLGVLDPAVEISLRQSSALHAEARAGLTTRTNDGWNRSDLVNSALSFLRGLDSRNYFRSSGGEGRVFYRMEAQGRTFEPFVGGRYEHVRPISAEGTVFSVLGRHSVERMLRPNPLVETGNIGSALVGGELRDTSGVVVTRFRAEVERSFTTMTGTQNFTQATVDLHVAFPTFGQQHLYLRGHGVASTRDSLPMARYAYLGGSGTLPVVELLELGGSQLVFLETRYVIPLSGVMLPVVGSPVLTLLHLIGSAGVRSLPSLEQEIGLGVGLRALRFDFVTDAGRQRGSKIGLGISLGH